MIQNYLELCKPRVVMLMLLTALVGMQLACSHFVPWQPLIFGTLGIACAASAAAVINQLIDRQLDAKMKRTMMRPLPQGHIQATHASYFAGILVVSSTIILLIFVNVLTTLLTLVTFIGYAVIYSKYLKRATPQNIVIGGLAGAMPPLLGWTAVTNSIAPFPLILVLIIFVWTPPHFWALALYRKEEYANAQLPMLPVTHGEQFTKLNILLYTLLLIAVSLIPYLLQCSGLIYLGGSLLLNAIFLYWSIRLYFSSQKIIAMKTFHYSITYLMLLFIFLLLDHFL